MLARREEEEKNRCREPTSALSVSRAAAVAGGVSILSLGCVDEVRLCVLEIAG